MGILKIITFGTVFSVILVFSHWFAINARSIISGQSGDRAWMANSEDRIHTLDYKLDVIKIHVGVIEEKIEDINKKPADFSTGQGH